MYASMVAVIAAVQHYQTLRERELRESELRRQMAEYELQVLRLQLHPHFLFNTLNGIATLMLRDVPTAREMLIRLGELLRIALQRSRDDEVTLRDELEFVQAYLDLEQMRFGERLRVRQEIDPEALDVRVPSMLFQPLVENAIQHGILQLRAGGTLGLLVERWNGTLRIRIVNDGPPLATDRTPAGGSGIGLGNTRARLWRLYGDAYRLQIVRRPEGGAEVRLEVPLRRAESEAAGA
jgi:LytS/YehU family sensor histidine kinase